eukprot:TRINITY_DN2963_c0_g1_i8.p1 TRINITY_DN2963_c0_g1~~TRINITY_DN2963_c0_g1_i8.p1  ORF type:complete len:536 (-),score=159.29 TRINITY_DN2963_c0_g1_i8:47-1654(-)
MDPWLKFSKYPVGTFFKTHMDAPYVIADDERTIFTVMIFLSDDFSGGETGFFERNAIDNDPMKFSIEPKVGRAIVFNHDTRHAGHTLTSGIKYIVRSEIIFRRTDASLHDASDPTYQEMLQRFVMADRSEQDGDVDSAHRYFQEALAMQASHPSIPSQDEEPSGIWAQSDIVTTIATMLSISDLASAMQASKTWKQIFRQGRIWKSMHQMRHPQIFALDSADSDVYLKDWFQLFRETHLRITKSKRIIIDLGSHLIKHAWVKEGEIKVSEPMLNAIASVTRREMHWTTKSWSSTTHWVVGNRVRLILREIGTPKVISFSDYALTDVKQLIGEIFSSRNRVSDPMRSYEIIFVQPFLELTNSEKFRIETEMSAMGFVKVGFVSSQLSALAAHGRNSGCIVNLGVSKTHVITVVNGRTNDHSQDPMGILPTEVTSVEDSIRFSEIDGDPGTVRKLREILPQLAQFVYDSISLSSEDEKKILFDNIILIGGGSQWEGFSNLFEQEFAKLRSQFKVIPCIDGLNALVQGGAIVAMRGET